MDFDPLDIAALIESSRALITSRPPAKVEFMWRRCAMYQLLSSQKNSLFPSVHLWQPDRSDLMAAVVQYEPGLQGESFWIAVHGHAAHEMCGLKSQRSQLCHMAYFKPYGIEKEAFEKKWNYLYAESELRDSAPPAGYQNDSDHDSRRGGIQSSSVDFVV